MYFTALSVFMICPFNILCVLCFFYKILFVWYSIFILLLLLFISEIGAVLGMHQVNCGASGWGWVGGIWVFVSWCFPRKPDIQWAPARGEGG